MYETYKNKVEERILETFNALKNKNHYSETNLLNAMSYSVLNGGKRLRPVMLLTSNTFAGGNIEEAMPLAVAIEMIHSYSLVHDDLPCMDNDVLRRGKNTTHIEYGEAMGLLSGDGLLNLAFEIMLEGSFNVKNLQNYNKAMMSIAYYSGFNGMIGGQAIDIDLTKNHHIESNFDTISKMYQGKTSALFIAAITAGAILGGADDKMLTDLTSFAFNLGIAFQIQDDILDVEADEKTLGKKTGRDKENDKMTIIKHLGLNESKKLCSLYQENSLKSIERYSPQNKDLIEIFNMIINRKN
jgi:geranylgeranyl diphosphate synthase type II